MKHHGGKVKESGHHEGHLKGKHEGLHGYMGGGKSSGFVTTPMNAPKKGFKGGK